MIARLSRTIYLVNIKLKFGQILNIANVLFKTACKHHYAHEKCRTLVGAMHREHH
jgi:hypothetical protein